MDIPGNGILAAVPVKAVAGRQTLAFLTDSEIKGGTPPMDFEYELIIVVLNEGYADLAMDAAREAGAGGGTVLHAKGTGGRRGERFYNVRFADEKDMIYIVAHKDEKNAVMKAINKTCGPGTEARGVCFSMPISSVMGLRSRVTEETES
jgi:nitrogen regulatory protein PII